MAKTDPSPCAACPWRVSNQSKRHPDGWYTKANLARLWAGLRRGEDMSCHPTDRDNPVSQQAAAAGYRAAPAHATKRECIGAQILKQREFMRLQDDCHAHVALYRQEHPKGLTRDGVLAMVNRAVFGGSPLAAKLPTPDLNEPDVAYPPVGTWEPRHQEVS